MADLRGFDASTVEPATDFDPIPAGKYLGVISDSEFKPTKSGNGNFLELTFEVLEGEYKGRRLWSRLNLDNPNADLHIGRIQGANLFKGEIKLVQIYIVSFFSVVSVR